MSSLNNDASYLNDKIVFEAENKNNSHVIKNMMTMFMNQSNDTMDSGLFSTRSSSDDERVSPGLMAFCVNLNDNNDIESNLNFNRTFDQESIKSDNQLVKSYTDCMNYGSNSDLNFQEQLKHQSIQDDYLSIIRNRFNSCSNIEEFKTWSKNTSQSNLDEPTNQHAYFNSRHNSFSIPNYKTYAFNAFSPETNLYASNNQAFYDVMQQQMINNHSMENNQMDKFECTQPDYDSCLDQNCNIRFNEDQKKGKILIKLRCNFCFTLSSLHKTCFERKSKLNRRRNSYNNPQISTKETNNEVRYKCLLCHNGYLKPIIPFNHTPFNQISPNFSTDLNNNFIANKASSLNNEQNENSHKQKNSKSLSKFTKNSKQQSLLHANQKSNKQQNNIQNYRKKSTGLITPIASTYMQSVRESRSPSPISYTSLNMKRQSVPVNIKKNRFRTISTESAISTPNSSFASNFHISNLPILHRKHSLQTSIPSINTIQFDMNKSTNLSSSFSGLNLNTSNLEEKLAHSGNMFNIREDWSILTKVPLFKQNTIHIRLEDEGPYGNDQTRCFLLSLFSTLGIRAMCCVLCKSRLCIYDRFPLVDGTFFCSPLNYSKKDQQIETDQENSELVLSIMANISNKTQFIYVVCLSCLHSTIDHEIRCKSCESPWKGGDSLQIGTMYKYEIFAAFPCCQARNTCNACQARIVDENFEGLKYFSSYSELFTCPACKIKDYHFVKPLHSIYEIKSIRH